MFTRLFDRGMNSKVKHIGKGIPCLYIQAMTFCGGLLIGSGILISGEHQYEGHMLASGTSALMSAGMGQRYLKTGKIMPAGIVSALGAVSLAYHLKKSFEWKKT